MARIVLLDAGPLGYLTYANPPPRARECIEWATNLRRRGATIRIPEGADYEVRRSLIRMPDPGQSIAELDRWIEICGGVLHVTSDHWRCASELWANARIMGIQPTHNLRLDFDTLLAAQAAVLERDGEPDVWIATENLGDLGLLFHQSDNWEDIGPG